MRKLLTGLAALTLLYACSDDTISITETDEAFFTTQLTNNDVAINPILDQPRAVFDTSSEGMYHGVIATIDQSLHGKIWINVGNDGNYNAKVITDEGEHLSFFAEQYQSRGNNNHLFKGVRGSFHFDVSDFNAPTATDVILDNIEGFVQVVKDRSHQRATTFLGTFQDDNDPEFIGTWDIITDGTPNLDAFNLPLITQVIVNAPGGNVFIDTEFDAFEYNCFVTNGPIMPVFLSSADGNEFWAQQQTADWGGAEATYSLGQSTLASALNDLPNTGFHNNEPGNPGPRCLTIEDLIGFWSWNGRSGSLSFDGGFNFTSSSAPSNVDFDGLVETLSKVYFEEK